MIELGLQRISKLLQEVKLPWRAIHVAGTNGKGSVCAYVSAMLHFQGVPCGRFTSPHLIDRWDCITINEKTVKERLFLEVENHFIRKNKEKDIQATEFEILTATAFEIFSREKVEVGVVEVGMGGTLDATNILEKPFCTVITKIGFDHEKYLGSDLLQIASHKAGIMKKGAQCVIDSTNDEEVLDFLESHAKRVEVPYICSAGKGCELSPDEKGMLKDVVRVTAGRNLETYQQMNLSLALMAVATTLEQLNRQYSSLLIVRSASESSWPGRQQYLTIGYLTGRMEDILLDGAHNTDSYKVLKNHVNNRLRPKSPSNQVTWVLASSEGKPELFFNDLISPGDNVATVEFGPVDGMPWVKPRSAQDIEDLIVEHAQPAKHSSKSTDVRAALQWASDVSKGGPLVVAGSLYLVSDVLRLLRDERKKRKAG